MYHRLMTLARGRVPGSVKLEGNPMENITINGKKRGRTKAEYESATHFLNLDTR